MTVCQVLFQLRLKETDRVNSKLSIVFVASSVRFWPICSFIMRLTPGLGGTCPVCRSAAMRMTSASLQKQETSGICDDAYSSSIQGMRTRNSSTEIPDCVLQGCQSHGGASRRSVSTFLALRFARGGVCPRSMASIRIFFRQSVGVR